MTKSSKLSVGLRENYLVRYNYFCTMNFLRGTTWFADKNALKGSLNFTLKEALPTIFLGVPRVWEKFQEKMVEIGQSNKGLRRQIGQWAKKTGLNRNKAVLDGATSGE